MILAKLTITGHIPRESSPHYGGYSWFRDDGTHKRVMTPQLTSKWQYPGARWWKFDIHTHTPASVDYGKGSNQKSLRQITPKDWLMAYMRAEVDCVAVTDHNSGEWIDRLKTALVCLEQEQPPSYRPLYLFPGVEITANGGIHVLAVFDVCKTRADVHKLLGAVEYKGGLGRSDVAANKSLIEVVKAITEAGGTPILAHIDKPSSAFTELRGNTLTPLLDFDGLYAMEVHDATCIENSELYHRCQTVWTEVLGSDAHHPDGSSGQRFPGSHFTWVKMAQPSLEGLRLALLDGEGFSIRRGSNAEPNNPSPLPKHVIDRIEIANVRYMGRGASAELRFSPWFNALVGGRGTGKSTVVHALRLSSGKMHELTKLDDKSEPRVTFERFNQVPKSKFDNGGLTDESKIVWTVVRDGIRYRVTWEQGTTPPTVEEAKDNNWKRALVQDLSRLPVRIFSQGQIAALAGDNRQALLHIIDQAAGVGRLQQQIDEARNAFMALRAKIRAIDGKLGKREQLMGSQEDVSRKLARFEEEGHKQILSDYRRYSKQHEGLEKLREEVESRASKIDQVVAELNLSASLEDMFDSGSVEKTEVEKIVNILVSGMSTTADELRHAAERLRSHIATFQAKLSKSRWHSSAEQARVNHDQLVASLQEAGIHDLDDYQHLLQEQQTIDNDLTQLDSMEKERSILCDQADREHRNILAARQAISNARRVFLDDVLAQNQFVRIGIHMYGDDPSTIERELRQVLGIQDDRFRDDVLVMNGDIPAKGIVKDLLVGLPLDEDERSEEFERRIETFKEQLKDACDGGGSFGGHFNNYLKREAGNSPELLDKLLAWFPNDSLTIMYSRRGDGTDFHPVEQASAGQRSAAMLAFLLTYGEEPLVLDQPEDDLDNHLIYDLIVRQIRENKIRRQLIIVTHNPNVVVNGDAEMLHVLDFKAGQCVVAKSGAMQQEAIREEVCRIIEGGREAFENRYRRLGREIKYF